ncbi:hypothetical protein P7C70_g4558, partial [Phenoliferia sp. Uapishka_3]
MGYISTYCQISGCSPVACDALLFLDYELADSEERVNTDGYLGENFLQALQELASEETAGGVDEREGQNDLVVVGPLPEDHVGGIDTPWQFGGNTLLPMKVMTERLRIECITTDLNQVLAMDASQIREIPHCYAGPWYEFGSVSRDKTDDHAICVSHGSFIMLQATAIHIMKLATKGRLSTERVWRSKMRNQPNPEIMISHYVLPIDYGEIVDGIDEGLTATPGFTERQLLDLEAKEVTVENIKRALVHEGKWWVWMRPDRFPLKSLPSGTPPSTSHTEFPTNASTSSPSIHSLPTDILIMIASILPLHSLLSLSTTSRLIRAKLLARGGTDVVARAWLGAEGVYWLPEEFEEVPDGGWGAYVQRCAGSGSMRNRKRIWGVVGRLEEFVEADEAAALEATSL